MGIRIKCDLHTRPSPAKRGALLRRDLVEVANMLEWITKYEPIWLFAFAIISLGFEAATTFILKKEYEYDEAKDLAKKQKRTRITKKTTTQPSGVSVIEESTETLESTGENHDKENHG